MKSHLKLGFIIFKFEAIWFRLELSSWRTFSWYLNDQKIFKKTKWNIVWKKLKILYSQF